MQGLRTGAGELYTAEAGAIRRIVQAAYRDPAARCERAAAAWDEAGERFTRGAPELLHLFVRL